MCMENVDMYQKETKQTDENQRNGRRKQRKTKNADDNQERSKEKWIKLESKGKRRVNTERN